MRALVATRNCREPCSAGRAGMLYRNPLRLVTPIAHSLYCASACAWLHVLEAVGLLHAQQEQKTYKRVGTHEQGVHKGKQGRHTCGPYGRGSQIMFQEKEVSNSMASLRICAITFDWYPFDVLVRRTAEAAADAGYC